MAELVLKLPRETCLEVLRNALSRAQNQLAKGSARNRRSDAYKALKLVRHMANRLRPLPDDFSVLLGEKSASEVVTEGMTIDPEPEEDFATLADDLPEFKQFASVFRQYPYCEVKDTPGFGKLLVLGYCSGRGKHSNKLYRRNCLLITPEGRRMNFREIGSAIGVPQETGPDGTHYTIKAVPYTDGMAVKFWTNIIDEGDVQDQYRYWFFSTPREGDTWVRYHFDTEVAWETHQHKYRSEKEAKAKRLGPETDIAPAPL
jgi:hypothetical protein